MDLLTEWVVRWQLAISALAERAARPGGSQRGAGILEYCLIIGLITVAIITVMNQFTGAVTGVFTRIVGQLGGIG